MPFAAALSEHPEPAVAVGEAIGEVLERLGSDEQPDLAILFTTAVHRGAFRDAAAAVRDLLSPHTFLGATAVAVVGGCREVEERPGVSLWAATGIGPVAPVRFDGARAESGDLGGPGGAGGPGAEGGPGGGAPTDGGTLILLPDPFSFPADSAIAQLTERHPGLDVVGGLASASSGPGGNMLALDGAVHADGAVGVLLAPGIVAATIVSQGCRPIGRPFTVTRAEGNLLAELGGRPAFERLRELHDSLGPDERALLAAGLHIGRVIDERKVDFERGDFLIRGVLGADARSGALAVGDQVSVGQTVQFQVRDAAAADEDLRALLATQDTAAAALLFTCNGRGQRFFGEPDHDASTVSELTGSTATAGMFCAGEIGPVGGRTFLHGYTASVALFDGST